MGAAGDLSHTGDLRKRRHHSLQPLPHLDCYLRDFGSVHQLKHRVSKVRFTLLPKPYLLFI